MATKEKKGSAAPGKGAKGDKGGKGAKGGGASGGAKASGGGKGGDRKSGEAAVHGRFLASPKVSEPRWTTCACVKPRSRSSSVVKR